LDCPLSFSCLFPKNKALKGVQNATDIPQLAVHPEYQTAATPNLNSPLDNNADYETQQNSAVTVDNTDSWLVHAELGYWPRINL
jgi:hypothetical protein